MNTADICRVHGRGDLTPIVWPDNELAPHLPVQEACSPMSLAARRFARERLCEQVFAAANGWAVFRGGWPNSFGGLDFKRELLPHLDHHVFFCDRGSRRLVAIVSHDYNSKRDFSALGDNFVVYRLPRSWYQHGGGATTAFLLRPTAAHGRRRKTKRKDALLIHASSKGL